MSSDLENQIEFCKDILIKAAVSNPERLANGIDLRHQMIEDIKANNKTNLKNSYRYQWVKTSTNKVLELLTNIAQDFNVLHGEDMCSVQDQLDIIEATKNALKKRK